MNRLRTYRLERLLKQHDKPIQATAAGIVTRPGAYGTGVLFFTEFLSAFVLVSTV